MQAGSSLQAPMICSVSPARSAAALTARATISSTASLRRRIPASMSRSTASACRRLLSAVLAASITTFSSVSLRCALRRICSSRAARSADAFSSACSSFSSVCRDPFSPPIFPSRSSSSPGGAGNELRRCLVCGQFPALAHSLKRWVVLALDDVVEDVGVEFPGRRRQFRILPTPGHQGVEGLVDIRDRAGKERSFSPAVRSTASSASSAPRRSA